MASEKQREANRRNALNSTGPKTSEGKAAVRLNSLRHGLRAASLILPGENREDFDALRDSLEEDFQPQSQTEKILVEQMAVAHWKLARAEKAEATLYSASELDASQIPLLDRIGLAQARHERSFSRALRDLQAIRKARSQGAIKAEKAETQAAKAAEEAAKPSPDCPILRRIPDMIWGSDDGPYVKAPCCWLYDYGPRNVSDLAEDITDEMMGLTRDERGFLLYAVPPDEIDLEPLEERLHCRIQLPDLEPAA